MLENLSFGLLHTLIIQASTQMQCMQRLCFSDANWPNALTLTSKFSCIYSKNDRYYWKFTMHAFTVRLELRNSRIPTVTVPAHLEMIFNPLSHAREGKRKQSTHCVRTRNWGLVWNSVEKSQKLYVTHIRVYNLEISEEEKMESVCCRGYKTFRV